MMSPEVSSNRVTPWSMLVLVFATFLVCALSSFVFQQLYVASRRGFGAGDVFAFLFWTAPFSLLLGVVAVGFVLATRQVSSLARIIFAILLGATGGFAWTVVVRALLGQWFGAFSFPVLYLWMIGGVTGMLFASVYAARRNA